MRHYIQTVINVLYYLYTGWLHIYIMLLYINSLITAHINSTSYVKLYVTGFDKIRLPHTSNSSIVKVYNSLMECAISLKF